MTPEEALARAHALEEACDFPAAARAALDGNDPRLAARLAGLARSDALFAEAELKLVEQGPQALDLAANDLLTRGYGVYAGRLFERASDHASAGEAFAAGGSPALAALAFERAGRPADGAKTLERALRDDPESDVLRRALADLLLRHGRPEAAVKVLQQMREGPEQRAAAPILSRSLRALGFAEAARQVDEDLAAAAPYVEAEEDLEVDVDPPPSAPPPSAPPTSQARPPPPPADAPAGPSPPAVLFGRFEVVREVAKTPHAHLFETIDRVAGRRVAVKVLAASSRGTGRDAFVRFEREARALLKLQHPTIVGFVTFISDGPAMVLEWMSGGSLAELMQREPFAPARAVEIASSVLTALGEAHRLGILHRDVKPSNVLFDDVGAPKLADFGAAHLGDLSTTVTAGAIGTFAYMSPEQRLGHAATIQSDVYAVGALLYEMITGEPAEPQTEGGFIERAPSAYHADLGPAHDALLARFLADSHTRRPGDAFEARKSLEQLKWLKRPLQRERARERISSRPIAHQARLAAPHGAADLRDGSRQWLDTMSERHVIVLPFDATTLQRIRPWAKVRHPALAAVLRASSSDGQIWLEAPRGRCLADAGNTLSPSAVGEIHQAISALHDAGGVHGALDAEHIYLQPDGVFVAYPRAAREEAVSATDDLRAVEELAAGRG